jgi:hypothetical protein
MSEPFHRLVDLLVAERLPLGQQRKKLDHAGILSRAPVSNKLQTWIFDV